MSRTLALNPWVAFTALRQMLPERGRAATSGQIADYIERNFDTPGLIEPTDVDETMRSIEASNGHVEYVEDGSRHGWRVTPAGWEA